MSNIWRGRAWSLDINVSYSRRDSESEQEGNDFIECVNEDKDTVKKEETKLKETGTEDPVK